MCAERKYPREHVSVKQKDNNHAKEIESLLSELEISPSLQPTLEVDVHHPSASSDSTVEGDDTETPTENPTATPNFFNTLSTLVDSQSIPTTAFIMESSPSNIINSKVCETLVVGPLTTTLNLCAFESPSRFTVLRDVDEVVKDS
ncbi:hypothetical protein YC2023_106128 [Brassica napus]